ncbi:MAG TPA: ATP-binding cassette domain-containing protein, partial [Candidatus Korarchaeota archaeon]|nr:ATP-binding cassette domain-containing protein [Candidatus Korarchaeota archaeon]
TEPTSGTARVAGHDVVREPRAAKMGIGLVPEASNVYAELSVWDNVMFSGEIHGVPGEERRRRAREILEMFELYDRRKQKAGKLSKGLKRRLSIAMALVHEPEVLFLDEPTSGLDVQSARLVKRIVRELNDNGTTIFLTTHNMDEANTLCHRVAVINRGRLAAIDTPERLKMVVERTHSVVVSFSSRPPWLRQRLERLPAVERVLEEGDKFRLYTGDPPTVLEGVFELARAEGLRILSLNTSGPTLEDVFIRLTGG